MAPTSGTDGPVSVENSPVPLLLIAIPVFFLWLGANAIWDANEAFYVETPRQMVLTGDYINPSFNGLPRFNKPVLSYWIVAGLYKAFGVSVAVERFGIALGAIAIVVAAFLIGRALRSTQTGVLAALVVATAPRVVMHARRIFIDVYLTAFMSIALAGFVLALRFPEQRRRWLLLTYAALGLGVLTKGPVALALPALSCGIWLVLDGRLREIGRLMLLPGLAIVAAIALPWVAAVYVQHGPAYITQFLFGENLERFATAMTPGGRDFSFYVPVLLSDLFPWAPLLLVPLATAWRPRGPQEPATDASIRRLLWIWIVSIAVFFSFSQTKEDLYIFPVVAASAALIADALTRPDAPGRRAIGVLFVTIAALCVGLGAGVARLLTSGAYALADAPLAAGILVATGLVAGTSWLAGRRGLAIRALAAGFIAFNYLFVTRVLPDAERFKPVPPLVRTLDGKATPGARIASFNMSLPSFAFYLRRPVPELASTDEAAALLEGADEAWLVTNEDTWNALKARVAGACLVDRHALFAFDSAKLTDIVHGTPPPDALLVTNRCGVRESAAATGPAPAAPASAPAR